MSVDHVTVEAAETDLRLDRWLARHYPGLTHGRIEKLLRTGQLRVDGARAKANQRLTAGQVVRVPPLGDLTPPKTAAKPAPRINLRRNVSAWSSCVWPTAMHVAPSVVAVRSRKA